MSKGASLDWEDAQPLLHIAEWELERDCDIAGGCVIVNAIKGDGTKTQTYIPNRIVIEAYKALSGNRA